MQMPALLHAAAITSILIVITSVVLARVLVRDRGKRIRPARRSRRLR